MVLTIKNFKNIYLLNPEFELQTRAMDAQSLKLLYERSASVVDANIREYFATRIYPEIERAARNGEPYAVIQLLDCPVADISLARVMRSLKYFFIITSIDPDEYELYRSDPQKNTPIADGLYNCHYSIRTSSTAVADNTEKIKVVVVSLAASEDDHTSSAFVRPWWQQLISCGCCGYVQARRL